MFFKRKKKAADPTNNREYHDYTFDMPIDLYINRTGKIPEDVLNHFIHSLESKVRKLILEESRYIANTYQPDVPVWMNADADAEVATETLLTSDKVTIYDENDDIVRNDYD